MTGFKINNLRNIKYSVFFSILTSFLITAGQSIEKKYNVFDFDFLLFIGLFILVFLIFILFLKFLPLIKYKLSNFTFLKKIDNLFFNSKDCFRNCMLFIFIFYIPIIIAFFPGIIAGDVLYHANFFMNHDFVEIHPVFYNLIVYLTLLLGLKIKSVTLSIYLYTLIQTLIMITIFSYCICVMSKFKISPICKIFTLLYFALHPINHVFCMSMDKDTLFSGFCILFAVNLIEIAYCKKDSYLNIFLAILSLILMFLLRHNAFFAFILIIPFLYLLFRKRKKIFALLLIPVAFYFCFAGVKACFKIKKPTFASYIATPLQQMGYVRLFENDKLLENEKADFRNIVSKENELNYNPYDVGRIKFDNYSESAMLHSDFIENSINENPYRFLRLYLKWAKNYPKDYINAFLLQTYLYWYPFGKWSKAGICHGIYAYTRNNWNEIFGIPIKRYFLIPSIDKVYFSIFHNNSYEKNPLIFPAFAIGINSFLIFLGFFILIYEKKYKLIISLAIIPALYITVLFGPCCLLRYVYQNFLILPLMIAFCFPSIKNIPKN